MFKNTNCITCLLQINKHLYSKSKRKNYRHQIINRLLNLLRLLIILELCIMPVIDVIVIFWLITITILVYVITLIIVTDLILTLCTKSVTIITMMSLNIIGFNSIQMILQIVCLKFRDDGV